MRWRWWAGLAGCVAMAVATPGWADDRSQDFSSDPDWDGVRHRSSLPCPARYQAFGYSPTTKYASGRRGEIGGTFKRSLRLASYAKDIGSRDLTRPLRASGMLSLPIDRDATPQRDGGDVVIGWFDSHDSHF